jgi:hypothetical protein
MRLQVRGDQQSSIGCEPGNIVHSSGANGEWLYYRWWMKIDSAFSWGSSTAKMKSNRVKQLGDVVPGAYTMYLDKSSVYVGECAECRRGTSVRSDPSDAYVSYDFKPSTNPAVAKWQEYIVGLKRQSCVTCSDGEFHLWVNGKEIGSGVKGMQFCRDLCERWVEAWGANMVRPFPQLNDSSAGGIMWIDDVELSTQWNSVLAARPGAPTLVVD